MAEDLDAGTARALHPLPASRYPILPRLHIQTRVMQADPALVVLTGRSGSGKTIAATQLAAELTEQGERVVWASLQRGDGEPAHFWRRPLGALVEANLLPEGIGVGRASGDESALADAGSIIRALSGCPEPLALIIDDLHHMPHHTLEGTAEDILEVLEGVPGLRMMMLTRRRIPRLSDIKARMRVPLVELLEEDLAFTQPEVERLLGIRLPQAGRDRVHSIADGIMRHSHGWPIAVHASIVERELKASGTAPVVEGTYIQRHVDDLLDDSEADEREMLMAAALLSEASPRVLAMMLGVGVERACELLDAPSGAALVYREDEQGERWYRHHALVRDELAKRAEREWGPVELRARCQRAAQALPDPHSVEAVRAALRAEDWAMLSEMLQGSPMPFAQPCPRPSPWLADIPNDVRKRYPLLGAFALIDEYAISDARPQKALQALEMLTKHVRNIEGAKLGIAGVTAAVSCMVTARLGGHEGLAASWAQRAQTIVDELCEEGVRGLPDVLSLVTVQRSATYLHAERFEEAERALQRIKQIPDGLSGHGRVPVAVLAALSAMLRGHVGRGRRLLEWHAGVNRHSYYLDGVTESMYRVAAAIEALERSDPAGAQQHLAALEGVPKTTELWPHVLIVETLTRDMRSGPSEALSYLEWQLECQRDRATMPAVRERLEKIRARLGWHAGKMSLRRGGRLRESAEMVYCALGWGDPASARAIVGRLLLDSGTAARPRDRAELLLLKAEAALMVDDDETAAGAARQSADILESHQLSLPLRALTQFSLERLKQYAPELRVEHGSPGSGVKISSPLTLGEQRTITAIAFHGSIASAAEALYLSPETIKSHLKRVYRKLGARDRAEALKIAGDAGLIDGGLLRDKGSD